MYRYMRSRNDSENRFWEMQKEVNELKNIICDIEKLANPSMVEDRERETLSEIYLLCKKVLPPDY